MEEDALLGPSPSSSLDAEQQPAGEPSLWSRIADVIRPKKKGDGVELSSVSVNGRAGYTELKDEKGKEEIKTGKKEEEQAKPDDRFFQAVAMALLDKATTKAELKTHLENFLHIRLKDTDPQDLGTRLRELCTDYTIQLHDFSNGALAQSFINDKYWSAFQQHQDKAFKLPQYAHISRGALPNQRDPAFFSEAPLDGNDKIAIAQFFTGPGKTEIPRQELAKKILKVFKAFTFARTLEFARLRAQLAEAEKAEVRDEEKIRNINIAMANHCATPQAINSYLFDESRLSPIYYSAAYNRYFEENPVPRGNKTDLVDYLMTRTAKRDELRVNLGKEILTIFLRNPAFSTPEFKRLNDAPVRDEKAIEQYCQSREAIEWYVMNTDYQKHLHYLDASSILFSSKTIVLSALTIEKAKQGGQRTLQPIVGEALRTCREEFPDIELPESYEILCKKIHGIGNIAVDARINVEQEITAYAASDDAYLWYVKNYLAHPGTCIPRECLHVLQATLNISIRIWQKTDDSKELELKTSQLKEKSPHTIDVVIVPDTNPESYRVLNRFNFNPLGEYSEFCNEHVSEALDTLSWIKKTLGPDEYEAHRKTMATDAGRPEIHGIIICELLAKAGIPLSIYVPRPQKDDYLFVDQNGCAPNLSAIEKYSNDLTIKIEQDNEGRFLPILSSGHVEEFSRGDFSVELARVHSSINDNLSTTEPKTVYETVTKTDINGKKTTVHMPCDQLQLITSDGRPTVKKLDDEQVDAIIVEAPYITPPVRTKTDEEIEREIFNAAWEINGGAIQDDIRLNNILRKDGEVYSQVSGETIEYRDIPNPKPAKSQPAIMEPLAERPPMPSYAPTAPAKPVTLKEAIQSGFTHNPLPPKKVVPEIVLLKADKEKRDALVKTIPKQFQLGQAPAKDSFFDSIAQQLNTLEGSDKYNATLVRAIANRMTGDAIPQRDAQVICEKLGITLHMVFVNDDNTVKHYLTDKKETKVISENNSRWNDKKILHIAGSNHYEEMKSKDSDETTTIMTERFVPVTKKPVKDNGLFDAVAKALDNVIFGNTKVSKEDFYTEAYLREACEHHLVKNLPEKNWVRLQLNSDPDNADYFESLPQEKDKAEATATFEVPLMSGSDLATQNASKKTPYRTYIDEVRYTTAQTEKTLPIDRDLELRLMCESLAATGKNIKIQVFEVQEKDIADKDGSFHAKKVIKKQYLYSKNGCEEITDPTKVNWGSDKVVTLIYDEDNNHFESCGSHVPRTWSFAMVNSLVHIFYGANLSYAMGMQALAAGAQAIMWGLSSEWVVSIMIGSGAGKWLLLWYFAENKFAGFPSTLNNVALNIYNLEDHLKALLEAFKTGNWSWGENVFPKMGGVALALLPAFFFGGLNKLILTGNSGFPSTVLQNQQMFQGWASGMIDLANILNNNAAAAYRLAFFSSFFGNLISARPIVEQIKRVIDKCIRDAKNVKDKGAYENARFWLGILAGTGISVIVTMGFINFWQLSTGALYADIIGADIPGAILGYTLSAGIMAFITGLGFCAAMPLGRKFSEYLFDIVAGDIEYQDGDLRKDNPDYQGFRSWWSEQSGAHQGLFIAAYFIAVGIVVAGAFPNVFQANLAGNAKFYAACAFFASMITELEGTEAIFEKILHKIKEFFEWIGLKAVDLYEWLRDNSHDLPFAVELKIRLVNALEKHFDCCKPALSNAAFTQRYGLFKLEPVETATAATASEMEKVFVI